MLLDIETADLGVVTVWAPEDAMPQPRVAMSWQVLVSSKHTCAPVSVLMEGVRACPLGSGQRFSEHRDWAALRVLEQA